MANDEARALFQEATGLGLFQRHGAFEVHCNNCHARLSPAGDCPTCGLIGRPAAEMERRAEGDPEGVARVLRGAIAKRQAYRPVGGKP